MYRDFLLFLVLAGLSPLQVNSSHLLIFLEYLHGNSISASNIENYLSAIKTVTAKYGLPVSHFADQRIQMFIRALKFNSPLHLTAISHLDEKVLEQILHQYDKYNDPYIYKGEMPFSHPRALPYLLNGPRPFKIGGRFELFSFPVWVLPSYVL